MLENGCWKLFSRQINGYTKFRPEIHAASTYISRLKTKPKKKFFLPELHWTEEGRKISLAKKPVGFSSNSLFGEFFNFTEKKFQWFSKNCKQTPAVHGTRTHVRGFWLFGCFQSLSKLNWSEETWNMAPHFAQLQNLMSVVVALLLHARFVRLQHERPRRREVRIIYLQTAGSVTRSRFWICLLIYFKIYYLVLLLF